MRIQQLYYWLHANITLNSFDAIGEVMRVNIAAIGLTENVDVRSYRFVDLNGDGK